MKNKINYERNELGQYVGGKRTGTRWIVGFIILAMGLTGVFVVLRSGKAMEGQTVVEAKQEDLRCSKHVDGIRCDFTEESTLKAFYNIGRKAGINWYTSADIERLENEKLQVSKYQKKYPYAKEWVLKKILTIADAHGYKQTDFLMALIDCESKFDPQSTNSRGNNPSWSVDRGIMQMNSEWQKSTSDQCAFDVDCSVNKAVKMLKAGKSHLWACTSKIAQK